MKSRRQKTLTFVISLVSLLALSKLTVERGMPARAHLPAQAQEKIVASVPNVSQIDDILFALPDWQCSLSPAPMFQQLTETQMLSRTLSSG